MQKFPYCQVNGKLREVFGKIRELGVPRKVDREWLRSIGYGSSADQTILPVIRFLGFIDPSGTPTERWHAYRDRSQSGAVLAQAIRDSYRDLYETYPDAHRQDNEVLENFFHAKTGQSERITSMVLATYRALCEIADFDSLPMAMAERPGFPSGPVASDVTSSAAERSRQAGQALVVNLNIQLTLPETTDDSVYERIFSAMKRHLWGPEE